MNRTRIGVVAVVLAFASLALMPFEAQTGSTIPPGKIALYDNARTVLILAADDGRVIARIRSNSYTGVEISPDGRWLALETYPRPMGMVVRPVSGGRARTVARCSAKWCPGSPSWNGDSSQVAYSHGPFIYTVFASGLGRTRVTRGETPDWSPSTPEIAFVRDLSYETNAGKIYVAGADGHDVRYITRGGYPAFHPSGRRLVFVIGRDVYTVSVSGGKPRRIMLNGFAPVWSPDGLYIAFTRFTSCGHAVCSGRVFIMPATGTARPRPIGPEIGDIGSFSWGR